MCWMKRKSGVKVSVAWMHLNWCSDQSNEIVLCINDYYGILIDLQVKLIRHSWCIPRVSNGHGVLFELKY